MEAIIPTLGLGTSCDIQAITLFPYRPTMEQHLSFEKGETIHVSEQQVHNDTNCINCTEEVAATLQI